MPEFGVSEGGFIVSVWLLTAVAAVLTAGRILIRSVVQSRFFLDDAFHLAAFLTLLALSVIYTVQVNDSWRLARIFSGDEAQPSDDEFSALQIRVMKFQFTLATLFWTCLYLVKFSFLGLYRLVLDGSGLSRAMLWGTAMFVLLSYGVCLSSVFTWCGPVSDLWDLDKCNDAQVLQLANQTLEYGFVFNVVTDLLIILIPMVLLHKLQTGRRQKIAIISVFALALMILVFDILRIVETFVTSTQFTFLTLLYTSLEAEVAVIICALPTYRFLIAAGAKGAETRRRLLCRVTGTLHQSNASVSVEDQENGLNWKHASVEPTAKVSLQPLVPVNSAPLPANDYAGV